MEPHVDEDAGRWARLRAHLTLPLLRERAAAPERWLLRAARQRGRERTVVVQAVKAAIAAVLAWILASWVLELPQPFLAPYSAVFLVEATVYRSFRSSVQQTGAVLLGVLLAAAVAAVVPAQAAAMGIAVVVGMLLGNWHRFGSSGVWIAVTALLLLSYGTANQSMLLLDRVAEAVLGAMIGLLVNALVVPPIYVRNPQDSTRALAGELAGLMRGMAESFRAHYPPEEPGQWTQRARDVESWVRQAEEDTDWAAESARFNMRSRRMGAVAVTTRWRASLVLLRSVWPYARELADAVHTASFQRSPVGYPGPETCNLIADLVEATADALVVRVDPDSRLDDLRRLVEQGERSLAALDSQIEATPRDALDLTIGLTSIMLPARKAFEQATA
ncbi:FUSC family protein [Amycolatopsis antarctica]|uniref:FUSC family protein n=1 Tax=Amycolatopsis antarctica TaxID=1854586 RepID=UPI0013FDA33E|nr:FUSC family protein [Amycolatopsis antarctica]